MPGRAVEWNLVHSRHSVNICWRKAGINLIFRKSFESWVPVQAGFEPGPLIPNLKVCKPRSALVASRFLVVLISEVYLCRSLGPSRLVFFSSRWNHTTPADGLPCLLVAARMFLERARVVNVTVAWAVMGALVYTVLSAFLPKVWEGFPDESVNSKWGLGRGPGLAPYCWVEMSRAGLPVASVSSSWTFVINTDGNL